LEKLHASVVINEIASDPLSDYIIDYLTNQKREAPYLDFKYTLDISKKSDFPEIAKDFFAFSNYGGGWILVGWKEVSKNIFEPEGLPSDYQVDQAILQEKFNSFVDTPLEIHYREFERTINGEIKKFAIIFIPPSYNVLTPKKQGAYIRGDKTKVVFEENAVFYRRGTQSIPPSQYEYGLLLKRLKNENYRLSLLSGNPDEVEEEIYSNLLPLIKMPEYVYFANKKSNYVDNQDIKLYFQKKGVFPSTFFKFKEWNKKLVTFEDLYDSNNLYSEIVELSSIYREPIDNWLKDSDKNRIVVELLNRELKHYAISKGMQYNNYKNKLFYPTTEDKRRHSWKGRYRKSTRIVASKMYSAELGRYIYVHVAFHPSFIQIGNEFFMQIVPSFILTEDGKRPIIDSNAGRVITRLSYDKYNSNYLNTILFWVDELSNGECIKVSDHISISSKLFSASFPHGISFDIPSSDFNLNIDNSADEDFLEDDLYGL